MSSEQADYPSMLRQVALLVDGPRTADALGQAADEIERLRRLLTRLQGAALAVVDWAGMRTDTPLPLVFDQLESAAEATE